MDIGGRHFTTSVEAHGPARHPLGPADLDVLAKARLFAGVPRQRLEERLRPSAEASLRAGAALLEPGQRHAAVQVLIAGRLAIYGEEDAAVPVAHVEPGGCVGEIALIDDEATAAVVVATERSRLLAFAPGELWQLMRDEHRVALNVLQILAERIRSGNSVALEGFRRPSRPSLISSIDPVTGLHNRRWLDDMFPRQIDRCAREGRPACMALIAIDSLDSVGDTFGRQATDLVLAQVARVMQKQFRPGDLLARCGAEEFAVLLPATRLDAAIAALERLRAAVEAGQTAVAQRTTVRLRICAGIAAWREGGSLEGLARCAREALRRAQASGGNGVCVAQPD